MYRDITQGKGTKLVISFSHKNGLLLASSFCSVITHAVRSAGGSIAYCLDCDHYSFRFVHWALNRVTTKKRTAKRLVHFKTFRPAKF